MGNCCKKIFLRNERNQEFYDVNIIDNMTTDCVDILKNCTNCQISDFSFCGLFTLCKVVDIYDADTFRVVFFRNKEDKEPMKIKVRASGCNAAEMYPLKSHPNRKEEMIKARLARNRLVELVTDIKINLENTDYTKDDIENMLSDNKKLVYIKFDNFDKYGRVLGTLYINKDDEISVNQILINENHAVSYSGGKRNKNKLTIS
jgi:endonuclease YncB( thermonuclease family)